MSNAKPGHDEAEVVLTYAEILSLADLQDELADEASRRGDHEGSDTLFLRALELRKKAVGIRRATQRELPR